MTVGKMGRVDLKRCRWEDLQNWGIGYGGTQMAYVRIVDFALGTRMNVFLFSKIGNPRRGDFGEVMGEKE